MSFTYVNTVPATNNDPSVDQPNLLANTQSINNIWNVDHIGFNAANGGTHQWVTIITPNAPPASSDDESVIYSDTGSEITDPYLYYQNASSTIPLSCVRAFGSFLTLAPADTGTFPFKNQYNVDVGNQDKPNSGDQLYTIPLLTNAVGSSNVIILVNSSSGAIGSTQLVGYQFTDPTLTLRVSSGTGSGRSIDFAILQV